MSNYRPHRDRRCAGQGLDPRRSSRGRRAPAARAMWHSCPSIHSHVAVMPDVHWGRGATVGSVIPTVGAIMPAAVGVDIGCGMCAVRTDLVAGDLPDSLAGLRREIERAVPVGRASHRKLPRPAERAWYAGLKTRYEAIEAKHPAIAEKTSAAFQIGTLGGGNHFIEVCLDEADRVWLMLHSGSRGIGNRIGSYFIELAQRRCERQDIHLPDRDLAYLLRGHDALRRLRRGGRLGAGLCPHEPRRDDGGGAARPSRASLGRPVDCDVTAVNCHHNYVAEEHHFGQDVSSPARAPCAPARATSASSRARWGRSPSSCAARATRSPSTPAPMARAARCRAARQAAVLPRGPCRGDGRCGVPQGRRRHRRDAGGLQGHRGGDGGPGRSRRGRPRLRQVVCVKG